MTEGIFSQASSRRQTEQAVWQTAGKSTKQNDVCGPTRSGGKTTSRAGASTRQAFLSVPDPLAVTPPRPAFLTAGATLCKPVPTRALYAPQSEVKDEIASGKVFIQGVDKAERPCMYVVAAKHLTAERDVEQCKRFICYSLDRAIEQIDPQKNPMGSITIIFDLRGRRPVTTMYP